MSDYSPTIEKAHPTAKRLMDEEFYWSPIEETAPFGSDDGADTYAGFADWRLEHKSNSPKEYLLEHLTSWGYTPFNFNETDFKKLKPYIDSSPLARRFMIGTDAAIIAIAFGQLYLEGAIDKDFNKLAKTAIQRELLPEMKLLWGNPYGNEEPKLTDPNIVERDTKLKKMLVVLNQID
jgi:uncharacterized protein YfeS